MIDRQSRDLLSILLRRFANGAISSSGFEDQQRQLSEKDPVIHAIIDVSWLFYDDSWERRLVGTKRLSPPDRREFVRWILFLDSDFEYVWPKIRWPGWTH
jgi:hypothetical protein